MTPTLDVNRRSLSWWPERTRPNSPVPVDVLIVDDESDTCNFVRLLLEAAGYTCAEAQDGWEAVKTAGARRPRLVLLDLLMPELNGLDTARALQAQAETASARLFCLSALNDAITRREAQEAGIEVFLTKPVDVAELLSAVSSALSS